MIKEILNEEFTKQENVTKLINEIFQTTVAELKSLKILKS